MKNKILFLYTEIAGYFVACLDKLVKQNVEVHLVRYPVNPEAPFEFKLPVEVIDYQRQSFDYDSLQTLVNSLKPSIVIACGWADKLYLKVLRKNKGSFVRIMTMDNWWEGTLKQQIARFLSPFFIKNAYDKIWIPGIPQLSFAKKIGFKDSDILFNFYSCDYELYNQYYQKYFENKKFNYPKRFIFVGRYIEAKGIDILWKAFESLQVEYPNDWELWCVGTGALWEQRVEHSKIKHFGFVQPQEIGRLLEQTGVFVLSSKFEPWGVVVHEYATCGYPILCTYQTGAASAFVNEGENGYLFSAGDVENLKEKMLKFVKTTNEELLKMSEISRKLAVKITPEIWTKTLIDILQNK